jgi:hypothetical protein
VVGVHDPAVSSTPPTPGETRGERGKRRKDDRARWLRAQLEPGEIAVASDSHIIVTERRIVFALRLHATRMIPNETREALRFDEITGWALGQLHDQRPLLRLRHMPRVRITWMPAHKVLRSQWGNSSGPVVHRESTLPFGGRRDAALSAIVARLEEDDIPRGDDFVIALEGTREERGGSAVLYSRGS